MMPAHDSVSTWIGKLKQGEAEAAQRLWERYFVRLVEMARSRLRGLPRQVTDEEDVALSAFHSFCQAAAQKRFPQLNNRDDLWQLLVMHTARKAINQRRYQQRRKRGGGDEGVRPLTGPAADAALEEAIGPEPDPQFAALVAEEFQLLLDHLNDPELRTIALRKLDGFSNREIAQHLDCSLRSVERKLAVIRGLWEEFSPP